MTFRLTAAALLAVSTIVVTAHAQDAATDSATTPSTNFKSAFSGRSSFGTSDSGEVSSFDRERGRGAAPAAAQPGTPIPSMPKVTEADAPPKPPTAPVPEAPAAPVAAAPTAPAPNAAQSASPLAQYKGNSYAPRQLSSQDQAALEITKREVMKQAPASTQALMRNALDQNITRSEMKENQERAEVSTLSLEQQQMYVDGMKENGGVMYSMPPKPGSSDTVR